MRKFERILRIVMYVSLIVGAWALSLGQFTTYIDNINNAQMRNAVASCMDFNTPHAVVVDGEVYCYVLYGGSEKIASLEFLLKNYGTK